MCLCICVCVCPALPSLSLSTCLSPSVFTWAGHKPDCKGCKKLRKLLEPCLNACIPSCNIISMWIDRLKGTKGLRRRVDQVRPEQVALNSSQCHHSRGYEGGSKATTDQFDVCFLFPCQRAHKHVAMKMGGLCMSACMLQLTPFSASG